MRSDDARKSRLVREADWVQQEERDQRYKRAKRLSNESEGEQETRMITLDEEERRGKQQRAVVSSEKDLIERKAKVMKRFLIVVEDLKKLQGGARAAQDVAFDRKLLTMLDAFYDIMGSTSHQQF